MDMAVAHGTQQEGQAAPPPPPNNHMLRRLWQLRKRRRAQDPKVSGGSIHNVSQSDRESPCEGSIFETIKPIKPTQKSGRDF